MTKKQRITLILASALFAILYFGFSTKKSLNNAHDLALISQDKKSAELEGFMSNAKSTISDTQRAQIEALEKLVEGANSVDEKVELMKKLSGLWFQFGQGTAAGTVAWQVAEIEKTAASWSVAGASFYGAITQSEDNSVRQICADKSVFAFGQAADLEPTNPEHLVNQALVWAEVPPQDNPMKSALTLRSLSEKYPDHPAPFNALGRLAIKTGQWEKAVQRLEHSWNLNKDNANTACLLAVAYQNLGDKLKSEMYGKICKK